MALRSVVLAPPPGAAGAPRRTVVLRPGGPKDKGKAVDVVACILGVLLLLACVVLVNLLPDKDYATPQFSVTYPETQRDDAFPSQGFDFSDTVEAQRIQEFTYDLPANVHSFTLDLHFADDDVPGSLPDQFRVEVFDPDQNPIGPRSELFSGQPAFNQTSLVWTPGVIQGDRIPISIAPKPEDRIVPGLSHREVREQVLARVEPQARIDSEGTWTVRVTMVTAGDCPGPGPDASQQQVLYCRFNAQYQDAQGVDPGNRFTIEKLIYNTFTVQVEELS